MIVPTIELFAVVLFGVGLENIGLAIICILYIAASWAAIKVFFPWRA
jgi:hypothetical protein